MKTYGNPLSEHSERALSTALGVNIGFFFPDAELDVHYEGIKTTSLSITLGHRSYLIIDCDWCDTPNEGIDYYTFKASLSDKPKGIRVTEHGGDGWLHHGASSLNTWNGTKIEEITIYEYTELGDTESVKYDSAIQFQYADGMKVLLTFEDSIAGRIVINYKPDAIAELLEPMSVRKTTSKKRITPIYTVKQITFIYATIEHGQNFI